MRYSLPLPTHIYTHTTHAATTWLTNTNTRFALSRFWVVGDWVKVVVCVKVEVAENSPLVKPTTPAKPIELRCEQKHNQRNMASASASRTSNGTSTNGLPTGTLFQGERGGARGKGMKKMRVAVIRETMAAIQYSTHKALLCEPQRRCQFSQPHDASSLCVLLPPTTGAASTSVAMGHGWTCLWMT